MPALVPRRSGDPLVVAVCLLGCGGGPGLVVDLPAAEAPRAHRVATYCELRPVARDDGMVIDWAGSDGLVEGRGMRLARGEWIEDPADLLAVVPPTSPTAIAVRAIADGNVEAHAMLWGGVAGGAASLVGLVHSVTEPLGDEARAGWAIAGGIAVVFITTGLRRWLADSDERVDAFDRYDESLRSGLGLEAADVAPAGALCE